MPTNDDAHSDDDFPDSLSGIAMMQPPPAPQAVPPKRALPSNSTTPNIVQKKCYRKSLPQSNETAAMHSKAKGKGRAPGAANYSDADLEELIWLVEEHLPIGSEAWDSIVTRFNDYTQESGCPPRAAKSLKLKFESVCHCVTCSLKPCFTLAAVGSDHQANQ